MEVDYLFKKAYIVDGTGNLGQTADVAILKDRIHLIASQINLPARHTIKADGHVLSPGFIDIHGHTDHYFFIDPQVSSKITQGITTEVCGNCGYSPFLLKEKFIPHFQTELDLYGLQAEWNDLTSFANRIAQAKPSMNWMTLVGHGTLRLACMGHENRPPTPNELEWMKKILHESLEQGACGLSTGLIYTPGCFAQAPELIELMKIVAEHDGFYATHMRSEGDQLLESIQEAIDISQEAQVPLQISHLKTAGEKNWKKIDAALEILEKTVKSGMDITWDRYPYTASYTSLDTYLPRKLFDGGDLKAVERLKDVQTRKNLIYELDHLGGQFPLTLIAYLPGENNKQWIGKSVKECSQISQKSMGEFVIDLLMEEKMQVNAIFFSMNEVNLERILTNPLAMIGSDASSRTRGGKTFLPVVHPRTYGTFPRFLKKFVIESKILSLEEAIHKMTGLTARRLGLKKRGLIKENFYADLVLMKIEEINDRATFQNSTLDSEGIQMVFVNGQPVLEKGQPSSTRSGRFLPFGES